MDAKLILMLSIALAFFGLLWLIIPALCMQFYLHCHLMYIVTGHQSLTCRSLPPEYFIITATTTPLIRSVTAFFISYFFTHRFAYLDLSTSSNLS